MVGLTMKMSSWIILGYLLVFLIMTTVAVDVQRMPNNRRPAGPIRDLPVVYPDEVFKPVKALSNNSISKHIPDNVFIRMQNVKNVEELLTFLDPQPATEGVPINGSDVNVTSVGITQRKKGLAASIGKELVKGAGCEIEMQSVELERPNDLMTLIWPMCTRLPRCGGCCTSSLLECVPTKVSKIEIKVIHARYKGRANGQFDVLGLFPIKLVKHEKCECECIERAEHCTPLQSYHPEECQCVCTNTLLKDSCTGHDHMWDSKECRCVCRKTSDCSTGDFFNMDSCKCEVPPRSSRIGGRRKISVETTTTIPTSTNPPKSQPLVGDFGAPMAHLNGGERSKLGSETHINIKPYDSEPFTLAQSRRSRKGRPAVRVQVDHEHEPPSQG